MKKINKKNLIIIITISILIIALSVGGYFLILKKDNTTKNNNEIPKEKKVVEEKKVQIVDTSSKSRPYAVMINNINVARDVQSGLNDAYIIYEIIVEGGITRYLALYKDSDLNRIGSIRSARHYYLDYVLENDAIYVHWGWSPQAQEDIKNLGINNINGLTYEGRYFYREKGLNVSSEHTGFSKMELLKEATDKLNYRKETDKGLLLNYSADEVKYSDGNKTQATNVTITYSNYITNKYEFDEETKMYKRFVNGKEQIDHNNGNQLSVKNIIIYQVNNYTIAGDSKGRQFLDNIGSGNGYYISNNEKIDIKWEKTSRDSKTIYKTLDGEELKVNDGNTFIQIVPLSGNIVVE